MKALHLYKLVSEYDKKTEQQRKCWVKTHCALCDVDMGWHDVKGQTERVDLCDKCFLKRDVDVCFHCGLTCQHRIIEGHMDLTGLNADINGPYLRNPIDNFVIVQEDDKIILPDEFFKIKPSKNEVEDFANEIVNETQLSFQEMFDTIFGRGQFQKTLKEKRSQNGN